MDAELYSGTVQYCTDVVKGMILRSDCTDCTDGDSIRFDRSDGECSGSVSCGVQRRQ